MPSPAPARCRADTVSSECHGAGSVASALGFRRECRGTGGAGSVWKPPAEAGGSVRSQVVQCERGESNPHTFWVLEPKSSASANSATLADLINSILTWHCCSGVKGFPGNAAGCRRYRVASVPVPTAAALSPVHRWPPPRRGRAVEIPPGASDPGD